MQIIAQCPKCSSKCTLDNGTADKRIKCQKCGRLFKLPKLEELPKAVRVIKQARVTVYVDESGKAYG